MGVLMGILSVLMGILSLLMGILISLPETQFATLYCTYSSLKSVLFIIAIWPGICPSLVMSRHVDVQPESKIQLYHHSK